jgi:hypothetical protein
MAKEEKLYQFGDLVFQQKHELIMSLVRDTKDYETDGVYDGVSDDFGLGKHFFKPYSLAVSHQFKDDITSMNALDWDLQNHHLLNSGKQKTFFSCIDDNYKAGDPIIKYNYAHVSKYNAEYVTKDKKLSYDIKLDSPFFFDCTSTVQYLADNAVFTPSPVYNDGGTTLWNNGVSVWSNPPLYQSLAGMTALDVLNNFGAIQENGKGKLFLDDQYFFDKNWVMPTTNGAFDYTKTINTTDFFGYGVGKYQANIQLSNLQLNGSVDNFCFILGVNKALQDQDYIEIINENNATGIRLQNISGRTIYGLNFYNFMNQELYDNFGKKLNQDGKLEVTKTIPSSALDYLYFDTTIKDKSTYYPSLKIYSNNNITINLFLKNQRIYS